MLSLSELVCARADAGSQLGSYFSDRALSAREVVSFQVMSDSQSLCLIMAGGDIITLCADGEVSLDAARARWPEELTRSEQSDPEVVGIVDAGIKAAKWSPDEELLVLVTGKHLLFDISGVSPH